MRITIFGLGYVGAVSGACLAELGHDVIGVDVSDAKIDMINRGEAPIVEELIDELTAAAVKSGKLRATKDAAAAVRAADVSLVSVGTPTGDDGAPELSFVDRVLEEIAAALRGTPQTHVVIIRSTVPPGSTQSRFAPLFERALGEKLGARVHLAFNPEFLREGRSVRDFHAPPFTIAGAMSDAGFDAIARLYEGVDGDVIRTDPATAESIKLLSNAWHGLKVSFANEAARVLKTAGVDARKAMEIFVKDAALNISPAYLRPGFAFGGSCLPKDLRAVISLGERGQVAMPIMRGALASNRAHIDAVFDAIYACGRRPAVLFGLAFKPGTDDMRESPYVALAEKLIGKGYNLKIIDPFVEASRLVGKNREFIEREIPHFVELMTRDAEKAVDEAEIIIVGHATPTHKKAIIDGAVGKILIDLSGDEDFENCGADYKGAAW